MIFFFVIPSEIEIKILTKRVIYGTLGSNGLTIFMHLSSSFNLLINIYIYIIYCSLKFLLFSGNSRSGNSLQRYRHSANHGHQQEQHKQLIHQSEHAIHLVLIYSFSNGSSQMIFKILLLILRLN